MPYESTLRSPATRRRFPSVPGSADAIDLFLTHPTDILKGFGTNPLARGLSRCLGLIFTSISFRKKQTESFIPEALAKSDFAGMLMRIRGQTDSAYDFVRLLPAIAATTYYRYAEQPDWVARFRNIAKHLKVAEPVVNRWCEILKSTAFTSDSLDKEIKLHAKHEEIKSDPVEMRDLLPTLKSLALREYPESESLLTEAFSGFTHLLARTKLHASTILVHLLEKRVDCEMRALHLAQDFVRHFATRTVPIRRLLSEGLVSSLCKMVQLVETRSTEPIALSESGEYKVGTIRGPAFQILQAAICRDNLGINAIKQLGPELGVLLGIPLQLFYTTTILRNTASFADQLKEALAEQESRRRWLASTTQVPQPT